MTRLRGAATTLATLAVTLGVLAVVMSVWGQPVTSALLGAVVAMMASFAVTDPRPRDRLVTSLLMIPAAAVSVTLAALLHTSVWAGDVAFLGVMVGAVLLRMTGPRGGPIGMIAFMSYFFALFLQATTAAVPALVVAAAVGALMSCAIAVLTRSRHPDHELRRMMRAWADRAGGVVAALVEGARTGDGGPRARRRLDRRVTGCSETARAVEQHLDGHDEQVWTAIGNDELSVRVFDAQLALERVAALTAGVLDASGSGPQRDRVAASLARTRERLGSSGSGVGSPAAPAPRRAADPEQAAPAADEPLEVLERALERLTSAWRRAADPRPDDVDIAPVEGLDAGEERGDGEGDGAGDDAAPGRPDQSRQPTKGATARQAAQVAVAGALAIVAGEALSPDRWFWAVITAFVVFTGAWTREEILSKGWLRVLGTLAGVVVGVVVASLVGDRTGLALALIGVCLFLGFYLMKISSAFMIFFITTMLALLYGLLGQFSIGLLVLRLEETTAGAVAGVLAAYLVFPSGTRTATRDKLADVLGALDDQLAAVGDVVGGRDATGSALLARTRALRDALTGLRATAKPYAQGLGGPANRTGTRRALLVAGASEHHARALGRLTAAAWPSDARPADDAVAPAASASASASADHELAALLEAGVDAVRATVGALYDSVEAREDAAALHLRSADEVLDAADRAVAARHPASDAGRGQLLMAAVRHLRAIDEGLREFAVGLGARDDEQGTPRAPDLAAAGSARAPR